MTKKHEPGMAFDMKLLNKVFAFLSVGLLITTGWVFLDDYLRPWKMVQIKAQSIKKKKIEGKIAKEKKKLNQKKLIALNTKLASANEALKGQKDEISKIEKEMATLGRDIKEETIKNGQLNSFVSATTFSWENAHSHHKLSAPKLFKKLQRLKAEFAVSKDKMKNYGKDEKRLIKKLDKVNSIVASSKKEIKDMTTTLNLLEMAKASTKTFTNPIWIARNAPIIDYLDPTIKIQQIVVPQVPDDRYFVKVPRVDRCITCHTFIDQKGYEKEENPFKTHPKLDLMVGKDSPHAMKKWGCTACHQGEGQRVTDFSSAAHTPNNPEQEAMWVKKYHYHPPHKVPQIMFRKKDSEASCVKCHKGEQYVRGAPKLNEGIRNVEKFGCYGCHKIEGWAGKRKPGPALKKIASKVSKEFFKNWVWDPRSFNEHAKMPSFFNQVNNNKPEFMSKNIVEVNAMADFIWSKSEGYKPFARYTGGNKARGKNLIKEVGCMGCHGIEGHEEASDQVDAYAGPYLTGTGSKVNGDWLVSWLKKPSHYQKDTIMPSFRLSTREANDIASYLMSLKNKDFEKLKFEKIDKELRDKMLLTYFSAFAPMGHAKAKLSKLSDQEKTLELGSRSVGKYGCYSCHDIKGFDGRAPIGPELTLVGSKPVTQIGFGHEKVPHSRESFFYNHMLSPRRWDKGTDKPFKDLNRMPNFYMSEREAETITTYLVGLVGDYIPLEGIKRLEGRAKLSAEGFKVINKYNCIGCHKVDGMFGDVTKMYSDDPNEGPPWLVGQGHRGQADWFYNFLGNVHKIRPWLKIRMPSFNLTPEEKNAIVGYFQHKDKQPTFLEIPQIVDWEPGEKAGAKKLWESYGCVTCHAGGFSGEEPTAPNLHYAKRRLRPSWIKKWLLNPQVILPYTPMPKFFEDGEAQDDEIFDGDVEKQVNALTKLILDFGFNDYRKALGAGNE